MSTALSWKKSSFLLVAPFVLIFLLFWLSGSDKNLNLEIEIATAKALKQIGIDMGKDWKSLDLKQSVDETIWSKVAENDAKIEEKTISIQNVKMAYLESVPKESNQKISFLLLHGMAFTSVTWRDSINTIQTLVSFGYRVIAVDLPGYGKTAKHSENNAQFLGEVIDKLFKDGPKPVVVSPSMSGQFSLPLLTSNPEQFCGYVPVAPAQTRQYSDKLKSVQVPTMIVYGQKDTGLGKSSANNLVNIPTATSVQIIPDARHPCYLDNPKLFHTMLYNFAKNLNC